MVNKSRYLILKAGFHSVALSERMSGNLTVYDRKCHSEVEEKLRLSDFLSCEFRSSEK